MALHGCSLTHKMTCGLIMRATGYYRFDLNVSSKFNKTSTATCCAPFTLQSAFCVLYFFSSYLNRSQLFRKQFCLLLFRSFFFQCFFFEISIILNKIFPTDDSEHEWIVRTCRKASDEVVNVDPEKSAAT